MAIFCVIDDKNVPLYRVMWVAATPHFCGHEDCRAGRGSMKSAWSKANRCGPANASRDDLLQRDRGLARLPSVLEEEDELE